MVRFTPCCFALCPATGAKRQFCLYAYSEWDMKFVRRVRKTNILSLGGALTRRSSTTDLCTITCQKSRALYPGLPYSITSGRVFFAVGKMQRLWCALLKKSGVCGFCNIKSQELPIQVFTHVSYGACGYVVAMSFLCSCIFYIRPHRSQL